MIANTTSKAIELPDTSNNDAFSSVTSNLIKRICKIKITPIKIFHSGKNIKVYDPELISSTPAVIAAAAFAPIVKAPILYFSNEDFSRVVNT